MTKSAAPKTVTIDGEEMECEQVEYAGVTYTIRELSVTETDEVDDLAEGQKPAAAARLTTRTALSKAIVEPKVELADIEKWGARKYVALVRAFNRLNSLPLANPTPPAGSAGPTSPDGGEQSPTT
jgi:hypothetical protein